MGEITRPADAQQSERMTGVARELQDENDPQAVLDLAADLAVHNVGGADAAGISVVHGRRRVITEAATSEMAIRGDQLQYETGEGPCLDAIWHQATVTSPSLAYDQRWPTWGPRVVEQTGAQSILSLQLFTTADSLGALNLYSRQRDGFNEEDRVDGQAVAAHVAIALATSRQITSLTQALDTRTTIGTAVGIVMERYSLDARSAFSYLTRVSTTRNIKIRDLASTIVEGRVIQETPASVFPDPITGRSR